MLINVPISQIDDNPFQRRQDYGDVAGLAADIQARGLLQKPVGRLLDNDGVVIMPHNVPQLSITELFDMRNCRVQLAFGHRRLRAFRNLQKTSSGWNLMPVYIEAMTDDQMLDAVWSENQHRSDINAIEQAELLAEKLERARAGGGNQTTVAAEWNLDRSTIANKIRLLELPDEVQTALRERRLSERQALALLPVLEMEEKLNGTAVRWSDAEYDSRTPRSPSGYVAKVLEQPEAATSDSIREYVRHAMRHAGKPLGDTFAAFEAGEGKEIIQSACKGCPKRQNQTCLAPACYVARYERYMAALGERAARETGLPYSEEEDNFPRFDNGVQAIRADWDAGRHENLVAGIRAGYYIWRPFTDLRYVERDSLLNDWKAGIIIGRVAGAAAEPDKEDAPLRPTAAEIKVWTARQAAGDRERTDRVKKALYKCVEPLAENTPAMYALIAMLDGRWLEEYSAEYATPSVRQLAGKLFEESWRRAWKTPHDGDNREVLRTILHNARLSPDLVDPPDPVLRLADIGQCALLRYEEGTRDQIHSEYHAIAAERLAVVHEALEAFAAARATVGRDEDLQQLAAYLRAAEEREQKILSEFAAENATSGDPVETEQPASVEVSA